MRALSVLAAYAVVVLAVAQLGSSWVRSAEDASIGGGLLLLVVLVLGLPWSIAPYLSDAETASAAYAALLAGCAILNAVLTYGVFRWRQHRTPPMR